MARRLIGLDIGTNAVTVAEVRRGSRRASKCSGRSRSARETMREGEVADEAAVTEAVGRLRTEVGLRRRAVRLGLASPRVVVRQVEMPVMTRDESTSVLQFQAAELIPIPLDDAVLDFAILGPSTPGRDWRTADARACSPPSRGDRAAARRRGRSRWPRGRRGRPGAARVDPTAAHGRPTRARRPGAGARRRPRRRCASRTDRAPKASCRSVAASPRSPCTKVGVPRFVRVLGTGGRELTDAIADRARPPARDRRGAEASTRRAPADDELVARGAYLGRAPACRCCSTRSAARSTTTATSPALRRCCASSRPAARAQLPGSDRAAVGARRCSRRAGPCRASSLRSATSASPTTSCRASIRTFPPPSASRSAAPESARSSICCPRARHSAVQGPRPQISPAVVAGAAAFAVLLGGVTFLAHRACRTRSRSATAVTAEETHVSAQLAALQPVLDREAQIAALRRTCSQLLTTDVSWQTMLARINCELAAGYHAHVVLRAGHASGAGVRDRGARGDRHRHRTGSSSGTTTTTTAPPPPPRPTITGHDHVPGTAKDYPTLAKLDRRDGQGPRDREHLRHDRDEVAAGTGRSGGAHLHRDRSAHAGRAEQSA